MQRLLVPPRRVGEALGVEVQVAELRRATRRRCGSSRRRLERAARASSSGGGGLRLLAAGAARRGGRGCGGARLLAADDPADEEPKNTPAMPKTKDSLGTERRIIATFGETSPPARRASSGRAPSIAVPCPACSGSSSSRGPPPAFCSSRADRDAYGSSSLATSSIGRLPTFRDRGFDAQAAVVERRRQQREAGDRRCRPRPRARPGSRRATRRRCRRGSAARRCAAPDSAARRGRPAPSRVVGAIRRPAGRADSPWPRRSIASAPMPSDASRCASGSQSRRDRVSMCTRMTAGAGRATARTTSPPASRRRRSGT